MKQNIHGAGLGLRSPHFHEIVKNKPNVPWFEILADNYLGNSLNINSIFYNNLSNVISNYPVTLHCVGMSLGSSNGINKDYLEKLNKLIDFTNPVYISDHLSWGNIGGINSHELLPLPYTDESLQVIINNIKDTQDFLGRQILVENVSSYISYKYSNIQEWDFITIVAHESGCKILLDINNIYVNSINHKFDPDLYIKNINKDNVKYFHLAGHEEYSENKNYLIDTHGSDINKPVWELFSKAVKFIGSKPCLLERDNNIPGFTELNEERMKIDIILNNTLEAEIV